jgi:hypothetical protein
VDPSGLDSEGAANAPGQASLIAANQKLQQEQMAAQQAAIMADEYAAWEQTPAGQAALQTELSGPHTLAAVGGGSPNPDDLPDDMTSHGAFFDGPSPFGGGSIDAGNLASKDDCLTGHGFRSKSPFGPEGSPQITPGAGGGSGAGSGAAGGSSGGGAVGAGGAVGEVGGGIYTGVAAGSFVYTGTGTIGGAVIAVPVGVGGLLGGWLIDQIPGYSGLVAPDPESNNPSGRSYMSGPTWPPTTAPCK